MSPVTTPSTPRELMCVLHEQLRSEPQRTAGITGRFAFDIGGDGSGAWWIEACDGRGAVHEGIPRDATLTVRLADETFMRVFGRDEMASADVCFTDVMTIDGDRSKAALLQQIFRQPAS